MKKQTKEWIAFGVLAVMLFGVLTVTNSFSRLQYVAFNSVKSVLPVSLFAGAAAAVWTGSPMITVQNSTNITQTTATVNFDFDSQPTTYYALDYAPRATFNQSTSATSACNTAPWPSLDKCWITVNPQVTFSTNTQTGSVNLPLTNLLPGTEYTCRLYATNTDGFHHFTLSRGMTSCFRTLAPGLTTASASPIDVTTATLNGTYSTGFSSVWMEYGTTSALGTKSSAVSVTSGGTANIPINALAPDTTYYFRISGTTAGGSTINGTTMTFKTLTPSVTTMGAIPSGPSLPLFASEFLDGSWTAGFSAISLQYGASVGPVCAPSVAGPIPSLTTTLALGAPAGATAGTSHKLVTALKSRADYCFRYIGTSISGKTYYGNVMPFRTL